MNPASMSTTHGTSVIIPAWNGAGYLPACLDALLIQDCPSFEVIVVDNASSDGSPDIVASRYPQVRLVRNASNLGFAGACNLGIRAARGEVLVLLNQDTRPCPGWLAALVRRARQPVVGALGCKVLYPDGRTLQHAGGWIEWPLGLARHYGQGEPDRGQWDAEHQVDYVTGASLAFRRGVVERVGLLDEGFHPGYYEDVDFCYTVREAGYEVWYTPSAVLTHKESASIDDAALVSRIYHRGRLRFLLKHMPPGRFLDDFLPAERAYGTDTADGCIDPNLRMAYLEALPMAAALLPLHWHADEGMIDRVLFGLRDLFSDSAPAAPPGYPSLREFSFRSAVPVIGPLFARVRSLWYSMAARWAVRHLSGQQNAINQVQDTLNQQQQLVNEVYAGALLSLSRELAHAVRQLGSTPGAAVAPNDTPEAP